MEFKIITGKIDEFEFDDVIQSSNSIILLNSSKKEQYFLRNYLNYDFKKRIEESQKANNSILENRCKIYFQYGISDSGKSYMTIKGIDILEKIEKRKYDF
jgi:hypothetical protein